MPACPQCRAPLEAGACASCGGRWLAGAAVDLLAPGKLAQLRRLVGKGPLTHHACADCGFALKALDVPGPIYEGDLFWGLESPRPAGTAVVDACGRCGGVFVDASNLERGGGLDAVARNLGAVMRHAS